MSLRGWEYEKRHNCKKFFLLFIFIGGKKTKIKKFFSFLVILIICHLENLKTIMCLLFKVT